MAAPWVTYVLRMSLGATFLLAGLQHVAAGGMAWAVGFLPAPEAWGWLLALGELGAGVGLVLGLLTFASAAFSGFVALGAMGVVLAAGQGLVWQNLAMAGAAVYVLAHGPGPASVDAWLRARRPGLARALAPWQGLRAERLGALGLRAGLGAALLGITAWGLVQGQATSAPVARLDPLLGLAVFAARPLVGLAVLAGRAPRGSALGLLGVGLAGLAATPTDFHPFVVVGAGAAMLLGALPGGWPWPRPARLRNAAEPDGAQAEGRGLAAR